MNPKDRDPEDRPNPGDPGPDVPDPAVTETMKTDPREDGRIPSVERSSGPGPKDEDAGAIGKDAAERLRRSH